METGMDEKPKTRPWFQFHLSTAIVLMFVAAGLLWLNMSDSDHVCFFSSDISDVPGVKAWHSYHWVTKGWPVLYHERYAGALSGSFWHLPGLCCDFAVALAVLLATGVLCEWRIRRKSAPPKDGRA
jgi:hypothetical protein